jgi:heterodisulfide reductase subunit A-like polyferredoxin
MSTGLTNSRPSEKTGVAAAPYKERVLIIGGGFAGIAAARGIKVEIVKTGSRSLSSRFSRRCWVRPRTSP